MVSTKNRQLIAIDRLYWSGKIAVDRDKIAVDRDKIAIKRTINRHVNRDKIVDFYAILTTWVRCSNKVG